MGGMSSQVFWRQKWGADAESTLSLGLSSLKCSIQELSSQKWVAETSTIGGVRDYKTSYLAPASTGWSSVSLHLDSLAAEPLAAGLSRLIGGPAIAFLEYDQAAWGYCLFEAGASLDRFWNIPDLVDAPPDACAGNVATLGQVFGASIDSIAPYIRHDADFDSKAFPDDEFTLGDHWVRTDFMRRLGLSYPNPGQVADSRHVQINEPTRMKVLRK